MRWRERPPEDPGLDADLAELGEWGPELLALREEPRPEFLADLDRRMQPDFARGRADEELAGEAPRRRPRRPAGGGGGAAAAGAARAPAPPAGARDGGARGSGRRGRAGGDRGLGRLVGAGQAARRRPVATGTEGRGRRAGARVRVRALAPGWAVRPGDRSRLAPGGGGRAVRAALLGTAGRLSVREPLTRRRRVGHLHAPGRPAVRVRAPAHRHRRAHRRPLRARRDAAERTVRTAGPRADPRLTRDRP